MKKMEHVKQLFTMSNSWPISFGKEPLAEKLTDNLAGLYFILYGVRGEQRRVSGCVTQFNVQFVTVEKLQK